MVHLKTSLKCLGAPTLEIKVCILFKCLSLHISWNNKKMTLRKTTNLHIDVKYLNLLIKFEEANTSTNIVLKLGHQTLMRILSRYCVISYNISKGCIFIPECNLELKELLWFTTRLGRHILATQTAREPAAAKVWHTYQVPHTIITTFWQKIWNLTKTREENYHVPMDINT